MRSRRLRRLFRRFDALLCPVVPVTAPVHGATELTIGGQTVSSLNIMKATVPFNITGLPALTMRFGTSGAGLPINVQLVSAWHGESMLLRLATELAALSPVDRIWPDL